MEQKKVNKALVLSIILFAIGVANKAIFTFFTTYGFVFAGVVVLSIFVIATIWQNVENRKRLTDILILMLVSIVFSLILYCSWDWAKLPDSGLFDFVTVLSNIYAVFSLFFLAYACIRYIAEAGNKKLKVVEVILGYEKVESKPKVKKDAKGLKEVRNGDLEDKPNQQPADANKSVDEKDTEQTKPE